jgi:NAD(P)-dependent dehydrogenase (short-subunit alcohol dehydrogenase family)
VSTVLVTGGAGDIGRAIAHELAAAGHRLVLADVAEISESDGADVATIRLDVTDGDAVDAAFARIGQLHGVVNNAGYQGVFAPTETYPLDDARRVLDVNVLGVMTVLAAAARTMIAADEPGAIVNVASMAGVSGAPNMPAYSASKAAVIGLTKAAAKDLAPHGIRVNAVSPGFIGPGRMWDAQVEAQAAANSQYYASGPATVARQMVELVPLRRCGSPGEVASVVTFLLSQAASYLTGVNIEISGGGP